MNRQKVAQELVAVAREIAGADTYRTFQRQLKEFRDLTVNMRETLREAGMEQAADVWYLDAQMALSGATKLFRRMR